MKTKEEIRNEIQEFVKQFGIGFSHNEIAIKVYREMEKRGYRTAVCNDRYVEVDGFSFSFIKIRKSYTWNVNVF